MPVPDAVKQLTETRRKVEAARKEVFDLWNAKNKDLLKSLDRLRELERVLEPELTGVSTQYNA
jgi:hypothetical protein